MLNICAIFAVLFFSSPVWAVCPQQEATVVFINGVWTNKDDAKAHKDALRDIAYTSGLSPSCVHFELSHSQDNGKADIAEAIIQKSTEFDVAIAQLVRMFLRLITPDAIFGEVIDAAYNRNVGEVVDTQLDTHVARVRELALERGHRAIVVTHSQGGLYGNALWQRLTASEQADTRLITVATPARDVEGGGPNTRLSRDGVANRYFLAASAEGLIPNTGLCDKEVTEERNSWLCHGFETGYLHDPGARAQIVADIVDALPVSDTACGNPPRGLVGTPYTYLFPGANGTGLYTFSVVAGALPVGLVLDMHTGEVGGLPASLGTFAFTLQTADHNHGLYPAGTTHCGWVDGAETYIGIDIVDTFHVPTNVWSGFYDHSYINGVPYTSGSSFWSIYAYPFVDNPPAVCTLGRPGYHGEGGYGAGKWFVPVYGNRGINPAGTGVIRWDFEALYGAESKTFYWMFDNGVVAPTGEAGIVGSVECVITIE